MSPLRMIKAWVARALRTSSWVHIRQPEAHVRSLGELLKLFDRFLDEKALYPLEWDDFISWPQEFDLAEAARDRIGESEPLLFSTSRADRATYAFRVFEERNCLATMIGEPLRAPPKWVAN